MRLICLGALALLPAVRGQQALLVTEHRTPLVVRAVRFDLPQVEDGAALRSASSRQYALARAAAYGSGFLAVADLQIKTWELLPWRTSEPMNRELRVHAQVTPDTDLKNCFLVIHFGSDHGGGIIFKELPDLRSGRTESLEYRYAVTEDLDESRCQLHFFSDGFELLTSQMPPDYVAAQKRKTEEYLLRSQADRTVTVLRAVAPAYPRELEQERPTGSATIRCQIDANGKLVDAHVVKALHPAFGEAALNAIRQWQFGPAVKDHHFVEATVDIPFEFPPPNRPVK